MGWFNIIKKKPVDEAIDDLKLFDDSEAKNALISAINFNMNRRM